MEQVEQRVDKSPEYVMSVVLLFWPGHCLYGVSLIFCSCTLELSISVLRLCHYCHLDID